MHYVYIIYSESAKRYYIGETPDINSRLNYHNDKEKNTNSTKTGIPWNIFWTLEVADRSLARKIEAHIKRMRNKKYYHALKEYPELSLKLIIKYLGSVQIE